MLPSYEQLPEKDVAREAYASALFEDMAKRIVSQQATIEALSAERDELMTAHSDQLNVSVTLGKRLIERLEENVELTHLTRVDSKTGLLNSVAFREEVLNAARPSQRAQDRKVFSLVFVDFDDFKQLNTLLGEVNNDSESLLPASAIFRSGVRQEDLVARWGGEEFALFLHARPEEAKLRMQSIREKINNLPTSHPDLHLGITIGIAEYRRGADYQEISRRANEAMRIGKEMPGKNTTVIWKRKKR